MALEYNVRNIGRGDKKPQWATTEDVVAELGLKNYAKLDENGNLGIGIIPTRSTLEVNGDIEITDPNKGIILRSPDNSRWRISVGNDGIISTTKI